MSTGKAIRMISFLNSITAILKKKKKRNIFKNNSTKNTYTNNSSFAFETFRCKIHFKIMFTIQLTILFNKTNIL